MTPDLMNLFAIIVIFGLVLWLINQFVPMAAPVKTILNILVVVVLLIYILQFFHVMQPVLPMLHLLHSSQ